MATLRRLFRDERGVSLLMAVAVLGVLSISAASLIAYSNSNARSAHYSKRSASAYGLAEAGINRALAVLYNTGNWALRPDLLPSTTETLEGGTVTWSGTLNQLPLNAPSWTLTATGTTSNPTGGDPITRTVTATVPVTITTTSTSENTSWNYVVSTADNGVNALDTMDEDDCDMTIGQNTDTTSPVYVFGDLCMESPSSIYGGTGSTLYVKGDVWLFGQNVNIGTSATGLDTVGFARECKWWNKTIHSPCNNGDGPNPATRNGDSIWVTDYAQSTTLATVPLPDIVPDITPPTADFDSWYEFAGLGPYSGCVLESGVPGNGTGSWATAFDDSAKVRNNNMPVFDLDPGADYSCQSSSGTLSWNNTTNTLTVSGSVFIDGSAKIDSGGTITYLGLGAIYLSGSLLIQQTNLCAVTTGSDCDWDVNAWDPNSTLLVFVTDGQGGNNPVPSDRGMLLRQTHFQGVLWSQYDIELDTSTDTEGPMVAPEVHIGNTVEARIFPSPVTVPFGLPGQTIVYPVVGSPTIIPD